MLYRDREAHYVFLRYWKSEGARRTAQEDPDMLRCWARLGNEIQIVKVYETLQRSTRAYVGTALGLPAKRSEHRRRFHKLLID